MPRLQLWQSGLKRNDYRFFDRQISEMFTVGGTVIHVHKYLGPYAQTTTTDGSAVPSAGSPDDSSNATADLNGCSCTPNGTVATPDNGSGSDTDPNGNVTTIEDPLFLENRDRKYDPNVYELYGVYNVQDAEFDLRQFGLFLDNDTLFISFHFNDMVLKLGRKIMPGDVLELPHLRDDYLLNGGPSVNKYYVVTDANRSSEGYSPTWWEHVWRVKVQPMPASQEFNDILNAPTEDRFGQLSQDTLGELNSDLCSMTCINNAVVDAARESVPERNFQTQQFYVVLSQPDGHGGFTHGDETCWQNPWIFAGDGVPPDGAILTGSGTAFPQSPQEGDYFLRLDYEPHVLFRFRQGGWVRQELDYRRGDWTMAHRILLSFINNDNTATYDDRTVHPEKVALSKAVRPSADF